MNIQYLKIHVIEYVRTPQSDTQIEWNEHEVQTVTYSSTKPAVHAMAS
jgi:hypothetical protein